MSIAVLRGSNNRSGTTVKKLIERPDNPGDLRVIKKEELYGISRIAGHAFCYYDNLMSITIPDSVTSIGDEAFLRCSGLTSITMGDSVTSIGGSAFAYCSSLTSATIPDSVTSIGDKAFNNCRSLTSITIGNSVTSIEDYAFYSCRGLHKIIIKAQTPPTLSNINAFGDTNNCPIYVPTPDTYRDASQYTNWAAVVDGNNNSRIFPLVNTIAERDLIDTTIYTKACVIGDNEYTEYTYDGTAWVEAN